MLATSFFKIVNRFDSSHVQYMYPGIRAFLLEPGPVEGWTFHLPMDGFCLNAGTINRSVLYEGTFMLRMVCIGFMMDLDSNVVVQGHTYDSSVLDINIGQSALHYVFPPGLIWVNMVFPDGFIRECIGGRHRMNYPDQRLMLTGGREEFLPLASLVESAIKQGNQCAVRDQPRLSKQIKNELTCLLKDRIKRSGLETPYSEGDKFRMHVLEKCHAFEQANRDQPLQVDALCKAAGIKRRTLQHYFKESYGMGPVEYFRTRRLNQVRTELMLANEDHTRVSDVAARWGFTHMGRFSQAYTRLFGENPSETLHLRDARKASYKFQAFPMVR